MIKRYANIIPNKELRKMPRPKMILENRFKLIPYKYWLQEKPSNLLSQILLKRRQTSLKEALNPLWRKQKSSITRLARFWIEYNGGRVKEFFYRWRSLNPYNSNRHLHKKQTIFSSYRVPLFPLRENLLTNKHQSGWALRKASISLS